MAEEKRIFNLEDFADGTLSAQVDKGVREILANICNPNTKPDANRTLNVAIVFKPSAMRDKVKTTIAVKTKLEQVQSIETTIYVGMDIRTGKIEAEEVRGKIRGQMTLEETIEQRAMDLAEKIFEAKKIEVASENAQATESVDNATEEEQKNTVIDMRKVGNK